MKFKKEGTMPEGVEVWIIAKQLAANLTNWELKKIDLVNGPTKTSSLAVFTKFRRHVREFNREPNQNTIINKVSCKGKYIYIELIRTVNGEKRYRYLVNHLGMAAYWGLAEGEHTAVVLELEQEGLTKNVYFDDQRNFGKFYMLDTTRMQSLLNRLGPSVVTKSFTQELFLLRAKLYARTNPTLPICLLLMDQTFVSGIGNYLRADVLYEAKIYPFRHLENLSNHDWLAIYQAIKSRVKASLKAGGTTIENTDMYGKKGKYDPLVYGKDFDPDGNPVKADPDSGLKSARTIHWVPKVQKAK